MLLIGLCLGALAFYFIDLPTALGVFMGLPIGLLNYYIGCRAVGCFGRENKVFGLLIALRWLLALGFLVIVYQWIGIRYLLGTVFGVEIQMFLQLIEGFLLMLLR